tara:strand:- start:5447 stop:12919 length:7473 start_codon:yes stop_codon:yes gene_type:complete
MSSFKKITIPEDRYEEFLREIEKENPDAPSFDEKPFGLQEYARIHYGGTYNFKPRDNFAHIPDIESVETPLEVNSERNFESRQKQEESWFGDAWKSGANNSVVGLSKKIIVGGELSSLYSGNLQEGGGVSEEYLRDGGDFGQKIVEFVSGIIHDIPFFVGTKGLGLTTAVAGQGAKRQAAKKISQMLYKDKLAKTEFNKLTAKQVANVTAKHQSKKKIQKELLKKTDDALDIATISKARVASRKLADKEINRVISQPQFIKEGFEATLRNGTKVSVGAPGMRRIFFAGAIPMAAQLGLHGGTNAFLQKTVQNIAQQINPNTGQPIGNEMAQSIFSRFSQTGQGLAGVFSKEQIDDVIAAGAESFMGGLLAGGYSMLARANRVGALNRSANYKKFMNPKVQKYLVDNITKERFDVAMEAGIFSASHVAAHKVKEATGFGWEEWMAKEDMNLFQLGIQNFAQFKVLRKVNSLSAKAKDEGTKAFKYYKDKYVDKVTKEQKAKTKKQFEKIKHEQETAQDKIVQEELNKTEFKDLNKIEVARQDGLAIFERVVRNHAKPFDAEIKSKIEKDIELYREKVINPILERGETVPTEFQKYNQRLEEIRLEIPKLEKELTQSIEKVQDAQLTDLINRAENHTPNKEKTTTSKKVKDLTVEEFSEVATKASKKGAEKAQTGSYDKVLENSARDIQAKEYADARDIINNPTSLKKTIAKENAEVMTIVSTLGEAGQKTKAELGYVRSFAAWLATNREGVTLKNATAADAQAFVNFQSQGNSQAKKLSRFFKARNQAGISETKVSASQIKSIKAAPDHQTRPKVTLNSKELSQFDSNLNLNLSIPNDMGISSGKPVPNTKLITKTKYMDNDAISLVSHMIGHHGSRQVAIYGNEGRRGLLLGDVSFQKYKNAKGKDVEFIEFLTKEKRYEEGSGGIKEVMSTKRIALENVKEINGINYYEVAKRLLLKRQMELKQRGFDKETAKTKPLFQIYTNSKSGNSKFQDLKQSDIQALVSKYVDKAKLTPHKFRHSLTQNAIALDKHFAETGSGGTNYAKFAKEYFLNHYEATGAFAAYADGANKFSGIEANKIRRQFETDLKNTEMLNVDSKIVNAVDKMFTTIGQEKSGEKLSKPKKPIANEQKSLMIDKEGKVRTESFVKDRITEFENKNPTLKGRIKEIESKEGNFSGRFKDGVVELVVGKATAKTFFHENIHNIEKYVRALGDKKLTALFDRGIKLSKSWGKQNDKDYANFIAKYRKDIVETRNKNKQKPLSEKQLDKEAHREYFTELGAKWADRYDKAKGFEKLKMWGESFMASVKSFFNKAGLPEFQAIIGKKSQTGYNPNIKSTTALKAVIKSSKDVQKSIEDAKLFPIMKETKEAINEQYKRIGINENIYRAAVVKAGLPRDLMVSEMSEIQGQQFLNLLSSIKSATGGKLKRKDSWNKLNGEAHALEGLKGISEKNAQLIKEALGLGKNAKGKFSLEGATEQQQKSYIHFLSNLKDAKKNREFFTEQEFEVLNAREASKGVLTRINETFKILTLPGDVVLRMLLPKKNNLNNRMADKFLDHFQTEASYFGYGQAKIQNTLSHIGKYVSENKLTGMKLGMSGQIKAHTNLLGYILDPALAKGIKFKPWEQKFINSANQKNSHAYNAVKEMKGMYRSFYNSLFKEAQKVLNIKDFETFKKEYAEKYVEQYYTRAFTEEALEHFNIGGKGREKFINGLKEDIITTSLNQIFNPKIKKLQDKLKQDLSSQSRKNTEKSIQKLKVLKAERFNALRDVSTKEGKEILNQANSLAFQLINKPHYAIKNKYLLKRMPKFENTFTDKNGNVKRTYKTDFESMVGRYTRTMSSFLATVKHFNEFSNIKGDYSTNNTSRQVLDLLSNQKNGLIGQYALSMLKSRLGLERNNSPYAAIGDGFGVAARFSATIGLSSPMSGLKNFVIGTAMTGSAFGYNSYLQGLQLAMKPEFRDYVTRIGGREVGAKELELTGVSKWVMDNVSFMTKTEAANRFVSVGAGRMTAYQLADILNGKKELSLFKNMRYKEAEAKMKDIFNLTPQEIQFVKNYGLKEGGHGFKGKDGMRFDKEINRIMDKISHYSHIKTQGATAEPFLPLWMQSNTARSLTLFYRMAYSGTHNIYTNVVKPLKRGNPLPAIRYGLAGQVLGGALWGLYAHLFGQENPKKYSDSFIDRVFSNFAKAETLGIFGYFLNPYASSSTSLVDKFILGGGDMIMQPALVRNLGIAGQFLLNAGNKLIGTEGAAPIFSNFDDMSKQAMVLYNHAHRVVRKNFTDNKKPFYDKINQAKRQWMEESDMGKPIGTFLSGNKSDAALYYDYIKEAFYAGDYETAARYIEGIGLYLYDVERFVNGQTYKTHAHAYKKSQTQLDNILKRLNPISLEDTGQGNRFPLDTKRALFLKWFKEKDPALHSDLIKEERIYFYGLRQVEKYRKKYKKKYSSDYWHEGKVFTDGLFLKPKGTLMGIGWNFREHQKQSKYMKSDLGRRNLTK